MSDENATWTVLKMLEWATDYFAERSIPSPRLSIEWLLADVLRTKRLNLYVQFDRPLAKDELDNLRDFVKRRGKHEPLQYITGSTSFYNAEIKVNPSVLIPRQETEELIDLILNNHGEEAQSVLDIGTGSGCIPIALALERPQWSLTGVDISLDALAIAKANNDLNKTTVNFLEADLLRSETLPKHKWSTIISNPPYIGHHERESLDLQVKNFEPGLALFCDDRTQVYKSIVKYAENNLINGGHLYLELHEEHPIENEDIFDLIRWQYTILKDTGNKRRFIHAIYQNSPNN
jgi:release factor glutamine methyltransferase